MLIIAKQTNATAQSVNPKRPPTGKTQRLLLDRPQVRLDLAAKAFWKATHVEGLPVAAMARHYLGDLDERTAARRLRDISVRLAHAARRDGRPDLAAVFERSATARERGGEEPTPERPSLEDFAEEFPDGFYSESELVALYEEKYPADAAPSRVAQAKRAAEALAVMGDAGLDVPLPGDLVSDWFSQSTAERLHQAGITTLADVLSRAAAQGPRWHGATKGIGAKKAAVIASWVHTHLSDAPQEPCTLGQGNVRRHRHDLLLARYADAHTGIVPLEAFRPPPALAGAPADAGSVTAAPRAAAQCDADAIAAWLSEKTSSAVYDDVPAREKHPLYRSYRREVERLWCWAVIARGKPLSAINEDDTRDYVTFLTNPAPKTLWIGPRRPRWDPAWKPFQSPLTPTSRRYAVTVAKSLFDFLCQQGYALGNPWKTIQVCAQRREEIQPKDRRSRLPWDKVLPALQEAILDLPGDFRGQRLRTAVLLTISCPIRISHLPLLRRSHMAAEMMADRTRWVLTVPAKSTRSGHGREVPAHVVAHLTTLAAMVDRGRTDHSSDPPIFPAYENSGSASTKPWSERAIFDDVKALIAKAAAAAPNEEVSAVLRSLRPADLGRLRTRPASAPKTCT